jgi:endonuclease/exonuclease/phosphatase family metal-dependent hydrolase
MNMPFPFYSPDPCYKFNLTKEKTAISKHFTKRAVPTSQTGRLLLATWNIANLGAQKRTPNARKLIAHILKRFDLTSVQEVNEKFKFFVDVVTHMGSGFDYIMNDTAGNSERLAFIYRKSKVKPKNLFGELALRPKEYPKRTVTVRYTVNRQENIAKYKDVRFVPFDRNPFIGSFKAGSIDFTLVNVHLYFGKWQNSKKKVDHLRYCRRVLEIFALSRWAKRRLEKEATYDKDIILLGDMNVPVMDTSDSAYKALVKFGMQPVDYLTRTGGSNIGNDRTYDQMAFAPGSIGNRIIARDVFDFDNAVFTGLWNDLSANFPKRRAVSKFNAHVKHHFSDHRPIWVELDTT